MIKEINCNYSNLITDYHQYRYSKDNKIELCLEIEYEEKKVKETDYDLVKPTLSVEVAKKFKNGSEMRSDLKMYQFPLKDSDFGWKNPVAAYRLIHPEKSKLTKK